MSDSDMDIDDEEVQVHVKHTIAGESELLGRPIGASNSQNDLKKHSDEQSKMTKDSCGSFENPQLSGYSGKNIMVGDEKGASLSRFPALGSITAINFPSGNEPEQKRAAHLCKFFAKGWCSKGNSCRFVHVNNIAGSSITPSLEERRTLDIKEGVRVSLLSENGVTSLHTRDNNIHLGNPPACQRVFPPMNEMRLMPLSENIARESLRQNCGADVTENRSLFINNTINSFALRSSFVHDHRPSSITSYRKADMESSSAPAWTGSGFTSVPMNEYASNLGHFENRTNTYGSGSLATLQAVPVSSGEDAQGNTCSDKNKVSSNDWEPSEPFKASFTIPPYILPSSDALYDPFTDVEDPEDRSLNAPLSSKGKHARNNPRLQKDGDTSSSGPQARGSNNDDKNSSCSQNQHQETGERKKMDAYGVVEGVATSVVDQNDAATPSKEISSSAAVLKRCKAAGHESWRRSDGSSHQKMLKSDEIDGEVRSDAGAKVMRQFRTAVVETIKEMLKPLWREGRFTKDVHNKIVKRAAEKIVSAAVQFHQVPTDTVSVEQYLSMSSTKIVKLVEGYVDRYGKP
uniref:Protein FRIGIDA-ESSENTIAL 1 n=1 Tax=Noccaea caerulescens TaxID=107243 RepID=A0A1J3GKW0_NOCCA